MNWFVEYYVASVLGMFIGIGIVEPPKNLRDLGQLVFNALRFPYFVVLGVVFLYRDIRAMFKSNG